MELIWSLTWKVLTIMHMKMFLITLEPGINFAPVFPETVLSAKGPKSLSKYSHFWTNVSTFREKGVKVYLSRSMEDLITAYQNLNVCVVLKPHGCLQVSKSVFCGRNLAWECGSSIWGEMLWAICITYICSEPWQRQAREHSNAIQKPFPDLLQKGNFTITTKNYYCVAKEVKEII